MMTTKTRFRLLLGLTLGSLLVLISCGRPADDTDADSTSVLRRANYAEPATLDPHRAEGVASNNVLRDLFEGLVRETPEGALEPGSAASWTISDDGKTYRFRLRDDARWSNGDPLDAEDFVAGLRRTVNPATNSTYASLLAAIENAPQIIAGEQPVSSLGVSAIDDKTLEVRLQRPVPYFLGLLLTPPTFPLHRDSFERFGDDFVRPENLVSNGAYKIAAWRIGDRLSVVRNELFWDANDVAIDRVEFLPIEDTADELNMFRAGELDITSGVPNAQYRTLRENYPDELRIAPLLGTYFLAFDTTEPPLDNRDLRKALSMAIDRDALTDVVLGSDQPGAWGFVPPGIVGYESYAYPWRNEPRAQQIIEAQALYDRAGYSDDQPLKLKLLYNTGDNHRKLVVAVQGMLRQNLGAEVELINEEWKVMLQTRRDYSAWDIVRFGWNGDYQDANTFLEIFLSDSALNAAGFQDAKYDTLVAAADRELDLDKRASLLREAEAYLMESYAIMPLYFYVSKHLVNARVEGFSATIMDRVYSRHLSIDPVR